MKGGIEVLNIIDANTTKEDIKNQTENIKANINDSNLNFNDNGEFVGIFTCIQLDKKILENYEVFEDIIKKREETDFIVIFL